MRSGRVGSLVDFSDLYTKLYTTSGFLLRVPLSKTVQASPETGQMVRV